MAGNSSLFALLGKHQASSLIATAVDFGAMIAAVQLAHVSLVLGTVIGATCGATANFALGRNWTFRATGGGARGQAARYAMVSLASLGWNALGMELLGVMLGLQYVVARLIVALVVSLAWNFPMQRYFVFRTKGHATP